MRELLPLRTLVNLIAECLQVNTKESTVYSKRFEDNKSCITVSRAPSMTSRTRHINVKYQTFRSYIDKDKGIEIEHVDTTEQTADMFTKGLCSKLFTKLREKLMGR